jgi:hypothetical protein
MNCLITRFNKNKALLIAIYTAHTETKFWWAEFHHSHIVLREQCNYFGLHERAMFLWLCVCARAIKISLSIFIFGENLCRWLMLIICSFRTDLSKNIAAHVYK